MGRCRPKRKRGKSYAKLLLTAIVRLLAETKVSVIFVCQTKTHYQKEHFINDGQHTIYQKTKPLNGAFLIPIEYIPYCVQPLI